jgi:hypothetical protein
MKIVQILKKVTPVNSEVVVDLKNMESPHYISKNSYIVVCNPINHVLDKTLGNPTSSNTTV